MTVQIQEQLAELPRASERWLQANFPTLVNCVQRCQVFSRQGDNTFRFSPFVIATKIDQKQWCAAWVLFTHPEVTKFGPDGVWQAGTFHYEIWTFDTQKPEPTLVETIKITRERHSPDETHPLDVAAHDINEIAISNGTICVRGPHTNTEWQEFTRSQVHE